MNWASPWWGLAVPGVAVLGVVVVGFGWRHQRRLARLFRGAALEGVLPRRVRLRRALRDGSALLGMLAAVVALAEPRFDKEIRTIRARGTDLVVVLDLSRSMDAQDVEPSRLERARREVGDLVRVLEQDRLGLVVYAGGAYPRLPLTLDRAAVELVVRESATDTFDAQGSALGEGIRQALALLANGDEAAGQAIVVLSDGETYDPDDAQAAAAEAAARGVTLFAVGVGAEESPIPLARGGWLEHGGEVVRTTPDHALLKELARVTGGAYVRSVAAATDMERLYRSEIRRKLHAVEREATQREVWRTAYQWPLGAAVLLLLGAGWLGDGRRLATLLALLVVAPAAGAGTLAEADADYRDGRYGVAADALRKLALEQPDDPGIFERLGAARYREGDFPGAARAWDHANRLGIPDADRFFNAGNAHHRSGGLEEALHRYERALELEPGHDGAAANLEAVQTELEERRKEPPPPPPDGEGGDPGEPGGEPQDPQPGEGPPPEDGEPSEDAEPGEEGGEGERLDSDEAAGDPSSGDPAAPYDDAGPITEGEAHRLLDGLEEGRHRVRVTGRTGAQPW